MIHIYSLYVQEFNASSLAYILGSIDDVPIIEGSVYWSTELGILSVKEEENKFNVGMESWFKSFDYFTYSYSMICITLFTLWYTIVLGHEQFLDFILKQMDKYSRIKLKRKKIKMEKIIFRAIKRLINKCFNYYPKIVGSSILSLIDEQFLMVKDFKTKIMSTLLYVFTSVLVMGYFFNLASVDMVAVQTVETIDSLSDLMTKEKFQNVTIMIPGGLWQETALKGAPSGSLENNMYQRIVSDGFIFPLSLKTGILIDLVPHLDRIGRGLEVLVIDKVVQPVIKSAFCQIRKDVSKNRYHSSKDSFGEKLLVPMISKSSSQEFIRWSRYKVRQSLEMKSFHSLAINAHMTVTVGDMSDYQKMICVDGEGNESTDPPQPFELIFFMPLIKICLIVLIMSLALLAADHFHSMTIRIIAHN